jgi:hypothetical protein
MAAQEEEAAHGNMDHHLPEVKPPCLTCRALRSPAFSFKGLAKYRPLGREEAPGARIEDHSRTVAILHVGRMDDDVQQEAERVDEKASSWELAVPLTSTRDVESPVHRRCQTSQPKEEANDKREKHQCAQSCQSNIHGAPPPNYDVLWPRVSHRPLSIRHYTVSDRGERRPAAPPIISSTSSMRPRNRWKQGAGTTALSQQVDEEERAEAEEEIDWRRPPHETAEAGHGA